VVSCTSDMGAWFERRNLDADAVRQREAEDLPREVVIYLLVTLARRPELLPQGAMAYLAPRYLGHCVGDCPRH
jgi:hypothetical protein